MLFVVQRDHAVKREIKTGISDGKNVEITDGGDRLTTGENVITQGNAEVADGMAVKVEEPGTPETGKKPDASEKPESADTPAPLGKAGAKHAKDTGEKSAP